MCDLEDYIVVVEDILPNDLCDSILAEYKDSLEWSLASVAGGNRPDIRSASSIFLSEEGSWGINPSVRTKLDAEIQECSKTLLRKYAGMFNHVACSTDSGYELLRYEVGGKYTEHVDHFLHSPRTVSCSMSINDGFEGGEFAFFGGRLKVKAPKGGAVMFPSNFMYPHQIIPVTKGVRYSIITWFL